MKKYGTLYSNLRVYYSREFFAYNPDEIIDPNEKIQEEKREIYQEMNQEGGEREK